jgi:hypothetical protein
MQYRRLGTRILGSALLAVAMVFTLASTAEAQSTTAAYASELHEMNPQLTDGDISGQAILTVNGGELHITLVMKGMPAGMRLAHIHGFSTDEVSTCPAASADSNGDDIVDLIETHHAAGTTLIPFNADPAGLQILSDTYPSASADGLLVYQATVSLDQLRTAVNDTYQIDALALGNRVIFVHGVADGVTLPDTVESLPDVPATVTVPIACGEVRAL